MTMWDAGGMVGSWVCLAQIADPVSTTAGVLARYGWPGFLALCIVGMWWDSRRREDKALKSAEDRDKAANERLGELNKTLGDLKLLLGRLLERHDRGGE